MDAYDRQCHDRSDGSITFQSRLNHRHGQHEPTRREADRSPSNRLEMSRSNSFVVSLNVVCLMLIINIVCVKYRLSDHYCCQIAKNSIPTLGSLDEGVLWWY